MCVISLKPQQLHCVPTGGKQPGQGHSAGWGMPGPAGTQLRLGSAPRFPEPWAGVSRQARQAAFVRGLSGDYAANHLVFWATGAIWS